MDILNEISLFLQTSVQMGTHILFAIVGGIICEKVGNMNLGIEGMMLMGAAVGFQVACATANPFLAVLSAGLAGLVGALIYAFITVTLRGNQVVTGLVLTIFGTGVAGFIGKHRPRRGCGRVQAVRHSRAVRYPDNRKGAVLTERLRPGGDSRCDTGVPLHQENKIRSEHARGWRESRCG